MASLSGRPWKSEDSPLRLTQGKSLAIILGNSSYNSAYLTQGKSLEILSKEPWSVRNVYIQVTMYSTKPPIFGRPL